HTLADVLRAPIDLGKLPGGTPESIRRLLQRCLDRSVKNRLRDIGEARVTISQVGKEVVEPVQSAPVRSRGSIAAWIAASVLAVALGVLAFFHFREPAPSEHALRYTIAVPDGGSIVHSFAVSPNGKQVVAAVRVNGKIGLWLRPMDALQWQPMPMTDEAI